MTNSYGFCVYHGIECDYEGLCIECPHNTKEDAEWFKAEEVREEQAKIEQLEHDILYEPTYNSEDGSM